MRQLVSCEETNSCKRQSGEAQNPGALLDRFFVNVCLVRSAAHQAGKRHSCPPPQKKPARSNKTTGSTTVFPPSLIGHREANAKWNNIGRAQQVYGARPNGEPGPSKRGRLQVGHVGRCWLGLGIEQCSTRTSTSNIFLFYATVLRLCCRNTEICRQALRNAAWNDTDSGRAPDTHPPGTDGGFQGAHT